MPAVKDRRVDSRALPVVGLLVVLVYTVLAPVVGFPEPRTELVVIGYPTIYGAAYWLAHGASLGATLSWTLPLAACLAATHVLIPIPFKLLGALLGVAVVLLMTTSEGAMTWWASKVWRRR